MLDALCKVFDKHGSSKKLTLDEIHDTISSGRDISKGDIEIIMRTLENEKYVDIVQHINNIDNSSMTLPMRRFKQQIPTEYYSSTEGVKFWKEQKVKTSSVNNDDK